MAARPRAEDPAHVQSHRDFLRELEHWRMQLQGTVLSGGLLRRFYTWLSAYFAQHLAGQDLDMAEN